MSRGFPHQNIPIAYSNSAHFMNFAQPKCAKQAPIPLIPSLRQQTINNGQTLISNSEQKNLPVILKKEIKKPLIIIRRTNPGTSSSPQTTNAESMKITNTFVAEDFFSPSEILLSSDEKTNIIYAIKKQNNQNHKFGMTNRYIITHAQLILAVKIKVCLITGLPSIKIVVVLQL